MKKEGKNVSCETRRGKEGRGRGGEEMGGGGEEKKWNNADWPWGRDCIPQEWSHCSTHPTASWWPCGCYGNRHSTGCVVCNKVSTKTATSTALLEITGWNKPSTWFCFFSLYTLSVQSHLHGQHSTSEHENGYVGCLHLSVGYLCHRPEHDHSIYCDKLYSWLLLHSLPLLFSASPHTHTQWLPQVLNVQSAAVPRDQLL